MGDVALDPADEAAVLALAIRDSGVDPAPIDWQPTRLPIAWVALPAGERDRHMDAARRKLRGLPSADEEIIAAAEKIPWPERSQPHFCWTDDSA